MPEALATTAFDPPCEGALTVRAIARHDRVGLKKMSHGADDAAME